MTHTQHISYKHMTHNNYDRFQTPHTNKSHVSSHGSTPTARATGATPEAFNPSQWYSQHLFRIAHQQPQKTPPPPCPTSSTPSQTSQHSTTAPIQPLHDENALSETTPTHTHHNTKPHNNTPNPPASMITAHITRATQIKIGRASCRERV